MKGDLEWQDSTNRHHIPGGRQRAGVGPTVNGFSGEQTVAVQPGMPWCPDCVLDYGKQGDFEVEMRVGVSIALLGHLADGLIYDVPWGLL